MPKVLPLRLRPPAALLVLFGVLLVVLSYREVVSVYTRAGPAPRSACAAWSASVTTAIPR